ncbi:hypothetical protein [Desulfuromonas thiophila]|uniref:Uncharacterized protein n=1 Tax=Desulfuromonas thiophila TaxID=57664 RepID=A0A1G7BA06_9BACT|nr:hypothetical protein [Desulfuromonas thiophila]SDE23650.1 hypothetical protein SAMN05661003_105126 [Desulfuromonas thiophila]
MEQETYLTTEELAVRLRYDAAYIRNCLRDAVLIEGIHYIRPFGRRKILYIWEAVQSEMVRKSKSQAATIPLSRGRVCHG